MVRYFTHRLTEAAIVLLLMSFCIYGLLGLMPGDPIDLMLSGDPNITSQDIARLKAVLRPRSPAAGALRPLAGRRAARRVRLFPAARQADARGAAAAARQHLSSDGHQPGAGVRARLAGRHRRRAQAALLVRLRAQSVRVRRHLGAVVLARAPADPAVRGRARLAAGGRRAERRRSIGSAIAWRTSCCRC